MIKDYVNLAEFSSVLSYINAIELESSVTITKTSFFPVANFYLFMNTVIFGRRLIVYFLLFCASTTTITPFFHFLIEE